MIKVCFSSTNPNSDMKKNGIAITTEENNERVRIS